MKTARSLTALLIASLLSVACGGGGGGSPTAPDPLPRVSINASPAPVEAIAVGGTEASVDFAFPVQLTFRETAGTSGRIIRLESAMLIDGSEMQRATLDVNMPFSASGSVSDTFVVQFSLSSLPNSISWRISAAGTDESGRSFSVSAVNVPITFPAPPAPGDDVLLFGGPRGETFLGCFTCSRYDSDSVHNPFGRYGSRFSSTSIWNHFSQYGSEFSTYSACNQFASSPPILVGQDGTFHGELTVNTLRPNAITNSQIQQWLRDDVCEL